jgi:hypothetical protein
MADYTTPPTLDPTLEQDLKSLVNVIGSNAPAIAEKLLFKAIEGSEVIPKVSLPPLIQLVNTLIIPQVQTWEGGWGDHPNDSGGATMRGVILGTLTSLFDTVFISTGIPTVVTAAKAFNAKYPTWKTNQELGKKALFILCGDDRIGGLFFHYFLASKSNRYPIAVMTIDPWLGFFFAECVWGSGAGTYGVGLTDIDSVAKKYGWTGGDQVKWVAFISGLGDKTAAFAIDCFIKRHAYIMAISVPESKNNVFRKGWLKRLVNDNGSDLMMLVKINEMFNQNTKGIYKLSTSESEYLTRKAETYKSLTLTLPD